ncbi:hypothetical protein ACFV1F_02580 [Streptomyces sp. NPDC059590]|uniref:hypothetical protein n=1 Tax=Streptomyces sp. NPDC059590 TaxID=3346877 RepID=UPI00369E57B0
MEAPRSRRKLEEEGNTRLMTLFSFRSCFDGAVPPTVADPAALGTVAFRAVSFCEPFRAASGYGWYLYPPLDCFVKWDGTSFRWLAEGCPDWLPLTEVAAQTMLRVRDGEAPDDDPVLGLPVFSVAPEPGLLQVWTGLVAHTPPEPRAPATASRRPAVRRQERAAGEPGRAARGRCDHRGRRGRRRPGGGQDVAGGALGPPCPRPLPRRPAVCAAAPVRAGRARAVPGGGGGRGAGGVRRARGGRTRLVGLVAAEGARPVTLDPLSAREAREFLGGRLGAARVAAEPEAADRLGALCARLPLALAIVAARAGTCPQLPLGALVEEMRDAGGVLDALDGGDPEIDLRAAFARSYRSPRGPPGCTGCSASTRGPRSPRPSPPGCWASRSGGSGRCSRSWAGPTW